MFPDEALLATDDLDDTDESHLCTFRDSVLQARGARPPHGRQRRHRHPGRRRPDLALRAYVSGTIRCPLDGSRVAPAEAARLARELADLSPKVEEIVLADTTGRGTLAEVEDAVRATQECVSLPIGLRWELLQPQSAGVSPRWRGLLADSVDARMPGRNPWATWLQKTWYTCLMQWVLILEA